MAVFRLLSGLPWQTPPRLSALVSDHIAPLFLITLRGRRKHRVHDLAKLNQVVRAEQTAARRNALEVVDAPQRRPGNRDTGKDRAGRAVHEVANNRSSAPSHAVVNPNRSAAERMKRVGDQSILMITRCGVTACIWKRSSASWRARREDRGASRPAPPGRGRVSGAWTSGLSETATTG